MLLLTHVLQKPLLLLSSVYKKQCLCFLQTQLKTDPTLRHNGQILEKSAFSVQFIYSVHGREDPMSNDTPLLVFLLANAAGFEL